jgi:hypothetical protein
MNQLLTVSLRQKAVYVPETAMVNPEGVITATTANLVANMAQLGFGVSEPLLKALGTITPMFQRNILEQLKEAKGVNKNWTPLVKGWDVPTGETTVDHIMTFFANLFRARGTTLPCGHIIPPMTFPLERYNGCPYCGTPFVFGELENYKQGSEQTILELWTIDNAKSCLRELLVSKTPLDATRIDSLKILLSEFPLPDVQPAMKETLMAVIDILIEQGKAEKAQALFSSPVDILRYLWYKHTGVLQIIEPSTIVKRKTKNSKHLYWPLDKSAGAQLEAKAALKLKYDRKDCLRVAGWLNNMPMEIAKMCEVMHPKRGMWVRFIRGLRLAEYSKRAGFEKLRELLDKFYNEDYPVWQADVNRYRMRYDPAKTLLLLQQRPGLFARSLFANMVWFGSEQVIAAFAEIVDKVPARLVFTLNMYADHYFDPNNKRVAKPLGGTNKQIPANPLLSLYDQQQLEQMKSDVAGLCRLAMKKRFVNCKTNAQSIYIDPVLFKVPVSIGDRSDNIQDLPAAPTGMRFPLPGNQVRLFMQWGNGLSAQHLDMDLSCLVAYPDKTDRCAFNQLTTAGCKHSGDIRSIPEKIGTAEYIEIDVLALKKAGARYVTFVCNAYSVGSITPNLVVGWMNSKHSMAISEKTGVAYDPSCVQHQVRIVNSLSKGLAFGVLDVAQDELIWLELSFGGQIAQNLSMQTTEAMLKKLDSKLSLGDILRIKAEAQNLEIKQTPEADEVYTREWAFNAGAVNSLLLD